MNATRTRLRRALTGVVGFLFLISIAISWSPEFALTQSAGQPRTGPILIGDIDGPINPATDDYLKTLLRTAEERNARLVIVRLNTPGGLVASMQTMVQSLLDSPVPTAIFVTPAGASATSAGVFITMAGNFAVMAPGTTIGAAHPVVGSGQDIQGDMRAKVENFAVSLIKAIAEQRNRNVAWAEKAVRESVSITDRDAQADKVIDFIAADMESLIAQVDGKTVTVKGVPQTLVNLQSTPREVVEMSFKQKVINVLSDPNVGILLGLGAMLGIGIELYHPGAILPGVVGVICLVLSLGSAQVLPINQTGVILLVLSFACFGLELMVPSFGVWGGAGVVCLVLGSIYLIDQDQVFGFGHYDVDRLLIGTIATAVGLVLLSISFVALRTQRSKVVTGKEGLIGLRGVVKTPFRVSPGEDSSVGKVFVRGELWN
ncbi:MAG: nodulation protein NfeD, partial [Deltaproteobacteria bacterium]|nr:nodulation protein NfeD [Deltaproteobacteria bacterium]